MKRKIVLASGSPRRRELLHQIGLDFSVDATGADEQVPAGVSPHEIVKDISARKARAVSARYPNAIIIAADTIGVLEGQIIGKPGSPEGALQMLRSLSGRSHLVITGFTVVDTRSSRSITRSVETAVWFRRLAQDEIDRYVESGEPLDKAGAYGIQGRGAVLVERVEGDFYNVVGLPLCALAEVLKDFGVLVL